MKYYFCSELFDEELCYPLKAILDEMAEHNMDSVMVTEAVRVTGEGFFYCKKYNAAGITADSGCGKLCEFYEPRNGKSGICKYWGYTYEEGINKYKLFITGLMKLINIEQS